MEDALSNLDTQETKGKLQRNQYIQDVGNNLFNKYKKELEEETLKQYQFHMHGHGAPDIIPPTAFILFCRTKLMSNTFVEAHLCDSNNQVCKEWVEMSDSCKKPWNECSEQLKISWC